METKPIKLNLGCGDKPMDGYINLDAKQGHSIYPLNEFYVIYRSVDEIRASHILEHFSHQETLSILKDWVSHLKPGGILKIAVPDFKKIAQQYLDHPDPSCEGYIMGGQSDENDYHKSLFDFVSLCTLMRQVGLTDIQKWTSEIDDCASLPISLNLMGTKPIEKPSSKVESVDKPKIAVVMSAPRLSITNNAASLFRTIAQCGIPCQPAQGVFWHHALTRQIEDRIAEGYDYLLAVDFDSWFLPGHVERLIELMEATPSDHAICAVQCEREGNLPIMGIHDGKNQPLRSIPKTMFANPVTRIHIGHFGLTLFRASIFEKLSKPWFRDEPDPNGSYREGRVDADVGFWKKFEAEGFRLFMANEVTIGHLQEICTFAGPSETNWRPVHVYLKDLNAGRLPDHCRPDYRLPTDT